MLQGKKAFIFGVLNDRSLGWHIADQLHKHGCEMGFSCLPGERFERRVARATESFRPRFLTPCDVTRDEDIAAAFQVAAEQFGTFDILVHSIAFAPRETFEKPFLETTREAWRTALDVSAYSLVALSRAALPLMNPGGSILTLTYHAAEKYVPDYNMMAVAKAALECSVRYLATELGRKEKRIRVNALSAGAVKTVAATGTGEIDRMIEHYRARAPLAWGDDASSEHVGKAGLYLLSDLASGVTGEVHYVDGGYNVMGW
ncbi:enoyl-ACP reductase FabI [Aquisphaera insulae]|uniref:enoyl-ACP reductase FabI n=1 Tax=Aquisphaera insulae TaxID=2712864 RepID=UPI00196B82A6|nr:enoyl-ACP reductase [Aquisphaera insulae]